MPQGYRSSELPDTPDYFTKVALDLVANRYINTKFGRNAGIGTATTPEDIWQGGDVYTGQPTSGSPETVEVFSSDGADAPAGTGALTIRFSGLKTTTSTAYETEDVTLNGVTAVPTTTTWWRINRAYVLTAGTGGANAGDITIRHTTTTANVFAVMPAGFNQTQIAAWTVPYNNTAIIKRVRTSISRASGAAGSANITIRVRKPGEVFQAKQNLEVTTSSPASISFFGGMVLSSMSDIKIRVESVSDNATIAEAAFEYFLIQA